MYPSWKHEYDMCMYVSMVVCHVAFVTLRLPGLHSICTNSATFSFVPSPQLQTFLPHTKGKEQSVYVMFPSHGKNP